MCVMIPLVIDRERSGGEGGEEGTEERSEAGRKV